MPINFRFETAIFLLVSTTSIRKDRETRRGQNAVGRPIAKLICISSLTVQIPWRVAAQRSTAADSKNKNPKLEELFLNNKKPVTPCKNVKPTPLP